jgi:branched-chain amino acid transport system permease protein
MDKFIYYLAAGICQGAVYSLIALGYTLVYGIIKLINFAHGEFYMAGAYAGFLVYSLLPMHISPWLSIPLIMLASGVAGALVAALAERVAYRPIRARGRLAALLTAIGVSFLLQNLANFIRNGNPQSYGGPIEELAQYSVPVGSGGIQVMTFVCIPASLLLTFGLWYIVRGTRFGKAMRATSQDLTAARLMGIDTDAVIRNTFVVGGFLAGLAGSLVAMVTVVEPMMGFVPGLNAFVAAVVGGIGSITGAMVGGYLLGIIQYMVVCAGVPSSYQNVASFVLLILVLVVRPEGILGKKTVEKV